MEKRESYLQYGREIIYEPGSVIYKCGSSVSKNAILYIVAGLVKIEVGLNNGSKFPLYLQPDNVFGIVEPLSECKRLTNAFSMEKSLLYVWDTEDFYLASSISWELTYISITGLTRFLRILNAEFGEKLGLIKERAI
ncbi:MAG: Crp/Fnr family transcriptional regulator [Spirochaetes bacterium]|nr:Crp/Fnr family transcriptional regulator [Spirochaetota bacterium]